MKKQDYSTAITVNASAQEAYTAINSVSKWWTENIEGATINLDDAFTVNFGPTFVNFSIIEIIPDKKVVWHVTDCYLHWLTDKTEWKGSEIFFDLSTQNNLTQIDFTHAGLSPEVECYNDCVKGWNQYIKDSLFKLINEGKGIPERKKMEAA